MNGGLNVSTIEMRPPPWSLPGSSDMRDDCSCIPRGRAGGKRWVTPGGIVRLYSGNKATSVRAVDPFNVAPGGWNGQITPDDAQLRPFIFNGDSFLYILNGRDEQEFTASFITTTPTGNVESTVTLEIKK